MLQHLQIGGEANIAEIKNGKISNEGTLLNSITSNHTVTVHVLNIFKCNTIPSYLHC